MIIEEVHVSATAMSLNERFTILQTIPVNTGQWRANAAAFNQHYFRNRRLLEQAARRYEILAKKRAVRERLGSPWNYGQLRRFGSENSLPDLRRSNSYGSIHQIGVQDRLIWMNSNRNLSRSSSFGNLVQATWRGRRPSRRRGNRGRFRGGMQDRMASASQRLRVQGSGGARGRGGGRGRGARAQLSQRGRGRGRGGAFGLRKPMPSKEELDEQLDEYMASTKSVLDKDLDTYMKNAMEID